MKKKLVQVSAFWKNDQPGGVGITDPNPSPNFEADVVHCLKVWDKYATKQSIEAQMVEFGEHIAKYGELNDDNKTIAMINIFWLESRNHLVADEFNGGLWMWEKTGKIIITT